MCGTVDSLAVVGQNNGRKGGGKAIIVGRITTLPAANRAAVSGGIGWDHWGSPGGGNRQLWQEVTAVEIRREGGVNFRGDPSGVRWWRSIGLGPVDSRR